jgi:hypothetical protein
MNIESEILFKGEAIGQLVAGPNDEMIIEYTPYRSLIHYEFVRALEGTEDTGAKAQIEIDGRIFTATEIVKPHFIRVSKGA